jgi:thioredoxin 1
MPDQLPDQLEVDLDTFALAREAGAAVLDVRNPEEYRAGHVSGALLIPVGELGARVDEIPTDGPLYVICATGARSLNAAGALVRAGYEATSVAGGTKGWIASGRPVVTGMSET